MIKCSKYRANLLLLLSQSRHLSSGVEYVHGKDGVRGSNPRDGSRYIFAGLVKRSNTADCKSAGLCLRRFESCTLHQNHKRVICYDADENIMIKSNKFILGLMLLLLLAALVSFLLLRDNKQTQLKPGDVDPTTGCTIAADGRGALCN